MVLLKLLNRLSHIPTLFYTQTILNLILIGIVTGFIPNRNLTGIIVVMLMILLKLVHRHLNQEAC